MLYFNILFYTIFPSIPYTMQFYLSYPIPSHPIPSYCILFHIAVYYLFAFYTFATLFNYNIGYLLFHDLQAIQQTTHSSLLYLISQSQSSQQHQQQSRLQFSIFLSCTSHKINM